MLFGQLAALHASFALDELDIAIAPKTVPNATPARPTPPTASASVFCVLQDDVPVSSDGEDVAVSVGDGLAVDAVAVAAAVAGGGAAAGMVTLTR